MRVSCSARASAEGRTSGTPEKPVPPIGAVIGAVIGASRRVAGAARVRPLCQPVPGPPTDGCGDALQADGRCPAPPEAPTPAPLMPPASPSARRTSDLRSISAITPCCTSHSLAWRKASGNRRASPACAAGCTSAHMGRVRPQSVQALTMICARVSGLNTSSAGRSERRSRNCMRRRRLLNSAPAASATAAARREAAILRSTSSSSTRLNPAMSVLPVLLPMRMSASRHSLRTVATQCCRSARKSAAASIAS